MQNDKVIQILEEAARKAGQLIFDSFEAKHTEFFKDSSGVYESLTTETDTKSQQLIEMTILSLIENAGINKNTVGFIGEEALNTNGEHLFIIDPIDGTTNFAFGIPYFCISIAYMHNGNLLSGVIYNPLENILYKAQKNMGAFKVYKNRQIKLKVFPQETKDIILAAHYNPETFEKQFEVYQKIITKIAAIRSMGSIALDLCLFAENKFHVVINGTAYIWDLAAANLIIEESGGNLLDWQGNKLEFDFKNSKKQYPLIASHPNNSSTFVDLLRN